MSLRVPSHTPFNRDDVRSYIITMLGGSTVEGERGLRVELTESQFNAAIRKAFDTFSRSIPRVCIASLDVSADVNVYEIPYTGYGVLDVQLERGDTPFLTPGDALTINLGAGVVSRTIPSLQGTYGIDEIYEVLQYSEMYQRQLGFNFEWDFFDGKLYIKNLPQGATEIAVTYAAMHDYESIPQQHRDWIRDFALAAAKQILGHRRRKFPIPGPGGQPLLQDANLVEEGKREEDELKQDLLNRQAPYAPEWFG